MYEYMYHILKILFLLGRDMEVRDAASATDNPANRYLVIVILKEIGVEAVIHTLTL